MKIKSWLEATRPKTLSASLAPILVASSYAAFKAEFSMSISVLALFASLAIQIASNLFNDAIDFKKGADENRSGPKRITQSGEASYEKVMLAGKLSLALAVVCGIPLAISGGMPILLLGLFSLVFAYAYTGGPFPLAYLGIADLFVVLFFGIIAVGGLGFIHLGFYNSDLFALGLQVGLLCNIMLAVNNLRDFKTDKAVGKNTLVARFGESFGRSFILVLVLTPFLINWYWFSKGMYYTALFNYILFPFACFYCLKIIKAEIGPGLNKMLALGSLYYISFSILLSLGMFIDGGY